jgi:CheY-like chemotaxis protein
MIYAGKESEVLEPLDISNAIEDMLGLLKVTVSKHVTLVADLDRDLPMVKAPTAQIRQIVMNLVGNASDAIENHDGVVRVSTGRVSLTHGAAGDSPDELVDGQYVQILVSDTGQGMSVETQAQVFDPFFTTKSAGRGLGLAVVHGIVRSLNGAIRISSELGKGSQVQILLPGMEAERRKAGVELIGMDQGFRPGLRATVLVVEDEEALRRAVARMLAKSGYDVTEAANGTDAIALLRDEARTIDCLLLDLTIPGATSLEVLAEAVRTRSDIKVILTSAYSEQIAEARLSAPQVCGFVRKPFQFGDLIEKLRNAMS